MIVLQFVIIVEGWMKFFKVFMLIISCSFFFLAKPYGFYIINRTSSNIDVKLSYDMLGNNIWQTTGLATNSYINQCASETWGFVWLTGITVGSQLVTFGGLPAPGVIEIFEDSGDLKANLWRYPGSNYLSHTILNFTKNLIEYYDNK